MRSSSPSLKTIVLRGLLALTFLFAQQAATLHWLSHAVDAAESANAASIGSAASGRSADTQSAHGSAPSEHCDECLVLGALGAAAAAGAQSDLPASFAQHTLSATPLAATLPAPLRLAFRSRAPPILV